MIYRGTRCRNAPFLQLAGLNVNFIVISFNDVLQEVSEFRIGGEVSDYFHASVGICGVFTDAEHILTDGIVGRHAFTEHFDDVFVFRVFGDLISRCGDDG